MPSRWRGPAVALTLVLLAGIAGYATYRWLDLSPPAAPEIAPDLVLQDADGRQRRLSEWRGKLLLVNFWASWCAPCLEEIPLLVQAQDAYGARGLQVIGPALDDFEPARALAQQMQINYPILPGEAEIIRAMEALGDTQGGLPFSVLVAPDGRILDRSSGAFRREELESLILEHLPPAPAA